MDRITVYQSGSDFVKEIMSRNEKTIADVVLADGFVYGESTEKEDQVKIGKEMTTLGVKKN